MFHHSLDRNVSVWTAFNWFILSFLAGNVNAGGFLSCHRFVSHVTGFATLAGVDLASKQYDSAIGILTVPLYFLLGSAVSAVFIDRRLHTGKAPRYALVMSLVAICLTAASAFGELGYFGGFGAVVDLQRDYLLLALLCTASGLQNAAITTASGSTVRTTHLTGITTDLGIGLVRAFYARHDKTKRDFLIKTNWLRLGSIGSFMLGSAVGAALFLQVGYLGFLLPAGIAVYAVFQELHHQTHRELEAAADRLKEAGSSS